MAKAVAVLFLSLTLMIVLAPSAAAAAPDSAGGSRAERPAAPARDAHGRRDLKERFKARLQAHLDAKQRSEGIAEDNAANEVRRQVEDETEVEAEEKAAVDVSPQAEQQVDVQTDVDVAVEPDVEVTVEPASAVAQDATDAVEDSTLTAFTAPSPTTSTPPTTGTTVVVPDDSGGTIIRGERAEVLAPAVQVERERPAEVLGEQFERERPPAATHQSRSRTAAVATAPAAPMLADTGVDTTGPEVIASGLIALGIVLRRWGTRDSRRTPGGRRGRPVLLGRLWDQQRAKVVQRQNAGRNRAGDTVAA